MIMDVNPGITLAVILGRVSNQYLHVDSLNLTLTSWSPGTMKYMPIVSGLPSYGTNFE